MRIKIYFVILLLFLVPAVFAATNSTFDTGNYDTGLYSEDSVGPSIFLAIEKKNILFQDISRIECVANDDVGVKEVTIDINRKRECGTATESVVNRTSCSVDFSPKDSGILEVVCEAVDLAENIARTTDSITVTPLSSGGDRTGKGAATQQEIRESRIFFVLNENIENKIEIKNADIAFKEINIEISKSAKNVDIVVTKLSTKPEKMSVAGGKILQYIEITHRNLKNENIKKVRISFSVDKIWLSNNGLAKEEIVLQKYDNGWQRLKTNFLKETLTEIEYEAESLGLSVFAIVGEKPQEEIISESEEVPKIPTGQPPESEGKTIPAEPEKVQPDSSVKTIEIILIFFGFIAIYVVFIKLLKKSVEIKKFFGLIKKKNRKR